MSLLDFFVGMFVSCVWGGSYVVASVSLKGAPAFFASFGRSILAFLFLFPLVGKPQAKFSQIIKLSFYMGVMHQSCWIWSLSLGLDSNLSVILMQLVVPITAILGHYLLGERLTINHIIGITISFIGLIIVVGTNVKLSYGYALFHAFISILGNSLFNIEVKKTDTTDMLNFLCYFSLTTAIMSIAGMLLFEDISKEYVLNLRPEFIRAILYLAFSSICASGAWYYLLSRYQVALVLPFQLLVPFFGFSFSYLFLNEAPRPGLLLGGFVTMIGIVYLYKTQAKKLANATSTQ